MRTPTPDGETRAPSRQLRAARPARSTAEAGVPGSVWVAVAEAVMTMPMAVHTPAVVIVADRAPVTTPEAAGTRR